jgi:Fic family protein
MKYHKQLLEILKATAWSQAVLAHKLGVSFATVNSWLNKRSVPRKKAIETIDTLYLHIVGSVTTDIQTLNEVKTSALKLRLTAKEIVEDKKLLDTLTLHLTYHTNTIEGSTMTLADVKEVIFDNKVLANRTAIEQTEARNHQATFHWLLDALVNNPELIIDTQLILAIHVRLMNGIISDAGKFRQHSVRIMGAHVPLANWQKIPDLIKAISSTMQLLETDVIKHIASCHSQFEQIHPFSDGNGRTGRLLMLVQALKYGLVPPLVQKERKYAYYKYLEAAQTRDLSTPLELFVAESIIASQQILE